MVRALVLAFTPSLWYVWVLHMFGLQEVCLVRPCLCCALINGFVKRIDFFLESEKGRVYTQPLNTLQSCTDLL